MEQAIGVVLLGTLALGAMTFIMELFNPSDELFPNQDSEQNEE